MQYDSYLTPQCGKLELTDVDPVHAHLATDGIIETAEEVSDACLAGSTGTDQCYHFTGRHVEGHVLQHLVAGAIAEVHSIEADLTRDGG